MRARNVRCLLMGGQSCIVYGAAEFGRDADLVVRSGTETFVYSADGPRAFRPGRRKKVAARQGLTDDSATARGESVCLPRGADRRGNTLLAAGASNA